MEAAERVPAILLQTPPQGAWTAMIWRVGFCAGLTAVIFVIDSIFVVSPAVSVLYIIPLLVLANAGKTRWVGPWACACVILTLAAFVIGLPESLGPMPLPNLAIGLTAILVTAQQLIKSAVMRRKLSADEMRYRKVFNTLSVAILECDFRPAEVALECLRSRGVSDLRGYLSEHPDFVERTLRRIPIIDVNETALKLLGVPDKVAFFEFLGDVIPHSDGAAVDCLIAVAERHSLFQRQTTVQTSQGDVLEALWAFDLGDDDVLDRVPISVLDVTQKTSLTALVAETREQLANAQQNAAVGQISASIAHELDQPLAAIQASSAAALRWLRPGRENIPEAIDSIKMVDTASARAKAVIQRIRSLVGRSETQAQSVAIDILVLEALLLVKGDVSAADAKLNHRLNSLALVEADRVLIQQVLVNLVRNAMQAMTEAASPEKMIMVETAIDGERVYVSVRDTGPGWPEEIRAKAFQPFRSTKATGMGLGLSICRAIIEAHHGRIAISDVETGGACVEFSLPVTRIMSFGTVPGSDTSAPIIIQPSQA